MSNSSIWHSGLSLRMKITDRCLWNCRWCHNEGSGPRNPKIVGDFNWNSEVCESILSLRSKLPFNEVHLTGGEPTQNPNFIQIVDGLKNTGLRVKVTTVGTNSKVLLEALEHDIDGINISLSALRPEFLQQTQINRSMKWACQQMEKQVESVIALREHSANIKLNVVVPSVADLPRIREILEWAHAVKVPIRLMNELSSGNASNQAIDILTSEMPTEKLYKAFANGSSSYSIYYRCPDGYVFSVKRIRDCYLDNTICRNCALKNTPACTEHFYGVRLEKRRWRERWRLYIRLCIHRTAADTLLPLHSFLTSEQIREIYHHSFAQKDNRNRSHFAVPAYLQQ